MATITADEIRQQYPTVPWKEIAGMRDRLILQNELMCYVPPNIELYRMAALYSCLMENG